MEIQPHVESARVIPSSIWERHRSFITNLYLSKEVSLKDIKAQMESYYDLKAT